MAKFEIWGEDDTSKTVLLAYASSELPAAGDTIVVRGQVREIEKVFRHHVGQQSTHRIRVGQPLGASDEEPPSAT